MGDFFRRHRNKLYFGGALVGGGYIISKLIENNWISTPWQKHVCEKNNFEDDIRNTHYEKTKQTAHATVLSLSPSLLEVMEKELPIADIVGTLQGKPANKLQLWEELKSLAFSRTISSIYISSFVVAYVNIKIVILGRNTFEKTLDASTQETFLSQLRELILSGLARIIGKVKESTENRLNAPPVQLGKRYTIEEIEGILKDIILELNGEINNNKLQPWNSYVETGTDVENEILKKMFLEVNTILKSKEFEGLVVDLVIIGLNAVVDSVIELYNSNPGTLASTTVPLPKIVPVLSKFPSNALSHASSQLLQTHLHNRNLDLFCYNVYEHFEWVL